MTLAFVVYFMLLLICTTFSGAYKSRDKIVRFVLGYLIPIVFVAIVFGGRFYVGSDWENYKDYYDDLVNNGFTLTNAFETTLEPIYMLLSMVVATFKCGSSYFFAVVAIIQFSIVYLLFSDNKKLLPFAFFFYIVGTLFSDINIIRQATAMGIVTLSIKHIDNKIKSIALLLLAIGFHYSAVIFVPAIFIDKKLFSFLDNTFVVSILFFLTLAFSQIISIYASGFIQMIDFNAKYSRSANNLDVEMTVSTGYGIIAREFVSFLLILLWYKLRKKGPTTPFFCTIYRVAVLGILLSNIFGISEYLSRLAIYYSGFSYILWAFMSYTVFNSRKLGLYHVVMVVVIMIDLAMFCMGILNGSGGCSPYIFKWIG